MEWSPTKKCTIFEKLDSIPIPFVFTFLRVRLSGPKSVTLWFWYRLYYFGMKYRSNQTKLHSRNFAPFFLLFLIKLGQLVFFQKLNEWDAFNPTFCFCFISQIELERSYYDFYFLIGKD